MSQLFYTNTLKPHLGKFSLPSRKRDLRNGEMQESYASVIPGS